MRVRMAFLPVETVSFFAQNHRKKRERARYKEIQRERKKIVQDLRIF